MEWVSGSMGSKVTMLYPCTILKGRGSTDTHITIALAGEGQDIDTGAKVYHNAPETSSTIESKSIAKDGGRTNYRGLVHIADGAENSSTAVECDALMFDNESTSDTMPYMEIEESKVDVAHEATVGKIGDEDIFYLLQSRGLDDDDAKKMIVAGFIEPITEELPIEYAVELNRLIELEMEGSSDNMSAGTQVHANLTDEQVREISGDLEEPEWLLEIRLEALDALEDLDMPDVIRTPGQDWTNLHELDFESLVDPLNAAENKDQVGPDEAEVLSWADAVQEHEDLLKEHFGTTVDPQENYLTALSTALFSTGTVVYVPEGVDAEDVAIRTEQNSRSLFNYTLVVTEESSSVTILERQSTGEAAEEQYYSGVVEVAAGENSYVQYGSLQNLSEEAYNFTVKRGVADTYATIDWIEGNLGTQLTKTEVSTTLSGDSSETQIVGAFYGHNDQHFDLDAKVWHRAEHTTADLVTRGVIDDVARSVYEGVQDVGTDAWDTSSYQRENTLMLSDESEADASPQLIINNHDTEASHSATVGQIDAEDLFYMTSRGVDPRSARNMLVEGFFVPVLEEIDVDELRDDLESLIGARLRQRDLARARAARPSNEQGALRPVYTETPTALFPFFCFDPVLTPVLRDD